MRFSFFLCSSVVLAVAAACSSSSDNAPAVDARDDAGADTGPTNRVDAAPSEDDASTSSDAAKDAPTVPSIAATDVCASYAKSLCAYLSTCFPKILDAQWEDPATQCEAQFEQNCVANHPVGARLRKDDADAYAACLGAMTCDDLYGAMWAGKCHVPRLAVTKDVGAPCRIDAECTSGVCSGTSTKCGQCVARVAAGGACTDSAQCGAGGYCNAKCYVGVGLGAACDTYSLCGTGLRCEAAKCVKTGGEGATCDGDSDCDLFSLVQCNKTAGKCEKITFLEPNATCPSPVDDGPPKLCMKGSRCESELSGQPGTCVPPAKVGESCGPDQPCEAFINCRGPVGQQKCVLPTYVSCP